MQDYAPIKKKMNWIRIGVIAVVLLIVTGIFVYKTVVIKMPGASVEAIEEKKLPRLVDLGAGTCIPCKQMAPILEELKKEYKGRVIIQVIDIYEQPEEAEKYGIRVIPTQILYDKDGNEVGRHEGFIAKEDLVKAFEQVGVK